MNATEITDASDCHIYGMIAFIGYQAIRNTNKIKNHEERSCKER